MFTINDYIIYSTSGVCKVADIVSEKNRDGDMIEYYVLNSISENNTKIKIPTNTTLFMRPLINVDEATAIVNNNDLCSLWVENERERHTYFTKLLKEGSFEIWMNIANSIHAKKLEKIKASKKLNQSDERTLKTAEKLLTEELSIILDKSPSEIILYK
ncbi:CarD family transcriptional regulator [uncultured Clostridium sp.]|uniref:CarD family transcriptional regulator n=1 Tax=uncultured Clostridium sp. TaxID=59620 RepID=UPI00261D832F|nr:CarD family transcriptional regulator [uncultured Clostridium sp.]